MILFKSRFVALVLIFTITLSVSYANPVSNVEALDGKPAFEKVTNKVGLDTPRNVNYNPDNAAIYGYLSAGQAWGDYNLDGYLDFYVTRHQGANELYRGTAMKTFERETNYGDISLIDKESGGASFADYDNDGDQDLYVLNNGQNILFRNDNTHFTNITAEAGVGDLAKGSSSSWADYNKDGYLDLYVTNWLCDYCKLIGFDGNADKLYKNNGDGSFSDVSHLLSLTARTGSGFIGSWFDYDNDGDLDLYVVNDKIGNPIGNQMFRNDGEGCSDWCFSVVSQETNTDIEVYGMGLGIADIDHDFDLDIYFSNMGLHVMLLNDGKGKFDKETMSTGTGVKDVGWSTLFFDYDNDMYEDLFVAINDWEPTDSELHKNTGRGYFDEVEFLSDDLFVAINDWEPTDSELHKNTGRGYFDEVEFLSEDLMAQGAAYADYNDDGWMDLLVGQLEGEYHLLENKGYERSYSGNKWISFDLEGEGQISGDAVGARIYLKTGNQLGHMKELVNGIGLGGGSQQILHFGLGTESVEEIVLLWPDGASQIIEDYEINTINMIEYQPDGVLTHNEIIEILDVDKYFNPMLDREDVIVLFLGSSLIAIAVIILAPVFTVWKMKKVVKS